jgi:DNA-binding beta-propeller fold protein YncE
VRDIEITSGGTILATVSQSGNAILREYTTDGRILAFHGTFYSQENPFGVALSKSNYAVITGLRQNCVHVLTQKRKPSVRFGSRGKGTHHFTSPYYITVNNKDEIVVADTGNHRVKVHKLDGSFIHAFGKHGSKQGELFYPMGICVDKYDNIYVADANNYRVQAFSPDGEFLGYPVKDTFEYGIDVKPANVRFSEDNVLMVVLSGSKFCQIHTYLWDVEKHKPRPKSSYLDLFLCCK